MLIGVGINYLLFSDELALRTAQLRKGWFRGLRLSNRSCDLASIYDRMPVDGSHLWSFQSGGLRRRWSEHRRHDPLLQHDAQTRNNRSLRKHSWLILRQYGQPDADSLQQLTNDPIPVRLRHAATHVHRLAHRSAPQQMAAKRGHCDDHYRGCHLLLS